MIAFKLEFYEDFKLTIFRMTRWNIHWNKH